MTPESLPEHLYRGLSAAALESRDISLRDFDELDADTQQILGSAASTYFNTVKHAVDEIKDLQCSPSNPPESSNSR